MEKNKQKALTAEMILNRLRVHLNEQRPVTLYNIYRGVPITYEADVAMIHPDNTIGLIVHPYQAVCIKHERRTYIESKSLPELIRAYPMSIDYTNHVVLLKKLEFPKSISTDLYHSWVTPEKTVEVDISADENVDITAKLMELAVLEENEIRIGMAVSGSCKMQRGDSVEISFHLRNQEGLIQVQGVVHSLKKIRNQDQKRMEIAGTAAMGDEISILAYVAKREDEIMDGLDKAYRNLRKGKRKRK
ncbi:MAG: hypothetical protein ACOCYU_07665 [Brevefilum sp.]